MSRARHLHSFALLGIGLLALFVRPHGKRKVITSSANLSGIHEYDIVVRSPQSWRQTILNTQPDSRITGTLTVCDQSEANIAGQVRGKVISCDRSQVEVRGEAEVEARDESNVVIFSGSRCGNVRACGASWVNLEGGRFTGKIVAGDSATVKIWNAEIANPSVFARLYTKGDQSQILICGVGLRFLPGRARDGSRLVTGALAHGQRIIWRVYGSGIKICNIPTGMRPAGLSGHRGVSPFVIRPAMRAMQQQNKRFAE